jgi:hypothetical protein
MGDGGSIVGSDAAATRTQQQTATNEDWQQNHGGSTAQGHRSDFFCVQHRSAAAAVAAGAGRSGRLPPRARPRAPRALQSWVPAAGLRVGILSDLSMNMSMHCLSSGITAGTFNLPRRKSHSAPRMGGHTNPNRMIYL